MNCKTTSEREAFEAAMSGEPHYWHRMLFTDSDGVYREQTARLAWWAWQKRATLPVADSAKTPEGPATAGAEPSGTFNCPICGKDTPHHHSDLERQLAEQLSEAKELADSEGTRAVTYLRRARKAEAALADSAKPAGELPPADSAYWVNHDVSNPHPFLAPAPAPAEPAAPVLTANILALMDVYAPEKRNTAARTQIAVSINNAIKAAFGVKPSAGTEWTVGPDGKPEDMGEPASTPSEGAKPDGLIALAELFHDTYERLAPTYGYETRPDTKKFDQHSKNGRLMVATLRALRKYISAPPSPTLQSKGVTDAYKVCSECGHPIGSDKCIHWARLPEPMSEEARAFFLSLAASRKEGTQ